MIMEKQRTTKRKKPQSLIQEVKGLNRISHQKKALLKNPWIKGLIVVGGLYGLLFVSKYVIREYADLITATKKLRNARRL